MGIGYFKGLPTEHVMKFIAGRVRKEGPGLAFYYFTHNTQIVAVPTSSVDTGFIFNETTHDFQAVTIQGQFTHRITNPRAAAELLNFSVEPRRRAYLSSDPEKLPQRITNIIQMVARSQINTRSLEEILRDVQSIAAQTLTSIRDQALLAPLGVELLSVYIQAVKPTPEVAKALEAQFRETLLRRADEAIYARRGAAVAEERKIKESELNTDIALEQQRQSLIELEGGNAQQEADYKGRAQETEATYRSRAIEMEISPYREFDPRTLSALALHRLGQNASRIGNLTITSEILAALLNGKNANDQAPNDQAPNTEQTESSPDEI